MSKRKGSKKKPSRSLAEVVNEIATELDRPIEILTFIGRLLYSGIDLDETTTRRAIELLEDGGLVVVSGKRLIPKATVLQGARTLARLSDDELEEGIVFPEQRLLGLALPGLELHRFHFEGPDGMPLKVRRVSRSLRYVGEHFPLLVPPELLLPGDGSEDPEFEDTIQAERRQVDLPALDIGELLTRTEADEPPLLQFELLSFADCAFRVETGLPSTLRGTEAQQRRWVDWMDRELCKAFEQYGPDVPPHVPLAHAYALGPKTMRTKPRLALEEYLERSTKVGLQSLVGMAILWYADDEPEAALMFPGFAPSRGDRDSLDAIFEDLGVDLTAAELQAFFRDAVLRGESDLYGPLQGALGGRTLSFHDERQRKNFEEFIQELWSRLCALPVSDDERRVAGLRARVLELIREQRHWLHSLDHRGVDPAEFPMEETGRLARLSGRLSQFVEILNDPASVDEFTLKRYEPLIEELAEALASGRLQVETALEFDDDDDYDDDDDDEPLQEGAWGDPAEQRARFEVIRGGAPDGRDPEHDAPEFEEPRHDEPDYTAYAEEPDLVWDAAEFAEQLAEELPRPLQRPPSQRVYRLEVLLAGSAPPIRRTLEVPGNITLGELHGVLQIAFEWLNMHLHSFRIGTSVYASLEDEYAVSAGARDEHRCFLQTAAPPAGSAFEYLYDFGDNWDHRVTVTAGGADDGSTPEVARLRCVDARGAAPPEDIGGIDSYLELIAANSDPSHEEHAFAQEVLGRSFDPERVSLGPINQALREFADRRALSR